jgi:uncharacterized protein YprB with RNaseH-like and TPR domain
LLRNSFIHIPGIGPSTERSLWENGIINWSDCLTRRAARVCGYPMIASLRSHTRESEYNLHTGNAIYFDRLLPKTDSWRMYADFQDRTAFVDVETTGYLGQGEITVIGLYDGVRPRVFVKGRNLADFRNEMRKYALLVTYNGTQFDVPFLNRTFGNIFSNMAHLDLQIVLQRLGYVGGLKPIQEQLGYHRDGPLGNLDGRAAIWLWEEHIRGSKTALNTLLRYNLEDVIVLRYLAETVYNESAAKFPVPVPKLHSVKKAQIDIPYDEELVRKIAKQRTLPPPDNEKNQDLIPVKRPADSGRHFR